MCRYAFYTYKSHYACFHCRKMFRQTSLKDLPEYNRPDYKQERSLPCLECGQPMHDMGLNFKAPRQHNVQQWRKIETLHANGLAWHDCGCGGSGPVASYLGEVKPFLEQQERRKEQREQARQKSIQEAWQEAKRKKHCSFRKPPPIRWEFYADKTTER